MKVFLQMAVGFVLAMASILSLVIFLLSGSVSAKGKYESLVTLEKQLVTTHVNADGTNVEIEEVIDEDTIAEGYDANMEKNKASAKKVNDSESSED